VRVDPVMLALVNRRQALGLSQQDLSARSGIHPARIAEWEQGKVQPQPGSVRRLAAALGIDLTEDAPAGVES
jgi:transcriptional regulator with XRE-family HTH domain